MHCLNISQLQSVTPAADKKPLVLLNLQWGGSAGTKITARYFTFKYEGEKGNLAAPLLLHLWHLLPLSDLLYASDVILFFDSILIFFSFNLNSANQREGKESIANKQTKISFPINTKIATASLEDSLFSFSFKLSLLIFAFLLDWAHKDETQSFIFLFHSFIEIFKGSSNDWSSESKSCCL